MSKLGYFIGGALTVVGIAGAVVLIRHLAPEQRLGTGLVDPSETGILLAETVWAEEVFVETLAAENIEKT